MFVRSVILFIYKSTDSPRDSRGLQGTYNSYSEKHGVTVPYGAVMVFSFACAQIMYAFTLRPDTLPRSYINWCFFCLRTSAVS